MSRSRWIALVALSEPALPDADALLAELARHEPDTSSRLSSQTDGSINLAWHDAEDASANITLVDRPIPWSQLEGPCATAWYWPEAESALKGHPAHLFVTLYDESTKPIDQATRLTRLLCALGATSPAVGFLWGASGAVHQPTAFAQHAAESTSENLPLNLWIDFRTFELDGQPGYGLFTTGLDALGHREIETPHYAGDPQLLVGGVYNVTHYLLEKGAQLKEGEVIGLPDGSEVTVYEGQSMIDPEQEAVRLEFGAA